MEITGNLAFIAGGLAASGPLAGDGNFLSLTLSADDWDDYTPFTRVSTRAKGPDLSELTTTSPSRLIQSL